MILFKIAFRNILRNARRSGMTMAAVAVGAIAMVLFGEFMAFLVTGFETSTVQRTGHLSVFRNGYFDFGEGNPAAYGINDYAGVIRMIDDDPALKPMLAVVTPQVSLFGIAGNFDIDTSKTFFGTGVVPSDRDRMRHWDGHHIFNRERDPSPLRDDDPSLGVVGKGLARILGLCARLKVANCPAPPQAAVTAPADAPPPSVNLAELAQRDRAASPPQPAGSGLPRIDLLSATAGGAPNVMSMTVAKAEPEGIKELDENLIVMHIDLAQQLLYGRGEHKATAIVIQLDQTREMAAARARLEALIQSHKLDLEVRDFMEMQPQYKQVLGLFGAIFLFIVVVMGTIVLFTVVNTMSMSVMERTDEIGTARAMGLRRSGIRRQFVIEGWMLGAFGACAGLVLAAIIGALVNQSGLTWTPPGQAEPIPLRLLTTGNGPLLLIVWLGLVAMATIAALIPANRAARLPVVDALRHV
jgi:putative ABC transport system permease protein